MTVHQAMIVAGGRGTRLYPLTYTCPKPLLEFCGAPFLSGVIRRLAGAGVDTVFLIVGADTEPFEVLREDARAVGVEIVMVPEPEPLDTAGGVRTALDRVDGPFLVLNGDILTDVDYAAAAARHAERGADATIVLTRVDDTSSYGVCVREDTRVVDFVEKPPPGTLPGQDAVNAGTYVLRPDILRGFPAGEPLSFERQVFPGILAGGGHIEGFVWDGVWQDLGTPERWIEGHRLALRGALTWPSITSIPSRDGGVRVAADAEVNASAILRPPVAVLAGAEIGPGSQIGPDTLVGRDGRVGADVGLRGSVLFDGVSIGDGISARALIAGRGAAIAEGARLGDGVVLGEEERVTSDAVLSDGERRPPSPPEDLR